MITTRGRYAVRVLLDLAENNTGSYIPLNLEIIVKDMVAGGLLIGASGKGGGYRLSRAPEDYVIGEVLELMEGPLAPVSCLAGTAAPCPRAASCETLPLWAEYDKLTHDFFYGKRLSDLLRN